MGSQTEAVLVFKEVSEMKAKFTEKTKRPNEQTVVVETDLEKRVSRMEDKLDKLISLIENDVVKKLEDLTAVEPLSLSTMDQISTPLLHRDRFIGDVSRQQMTKSLELCQNEKEENVCDAAGQDLPNEIPEVQPNEDPVVQLNEAPEVQSNEVPEVQTNEDPEVQTNEAPEVQSNEAPAQSNEVPEVQPNVNASPPKQQPTERRQSKQRLEFDTVQPHHNQVFPTVECTEEQQMFVTVDPANPLQMVLYNASASDIQLQLPNSNTFGDGSDSHVRLEQTRMDESVDETHTNSVFSGERNEVLQAIKYDGISNYIEIQSHEDMKSVKSSKVRISRQLARSTKEKASNAGNFGWQIAQKIYSIDERIGRNYAGRGKPGWSPRRKEALEEAVKENYGPEKCHVEQMRKACDSGMRNIKIPKKPTIQQSSAMILPENTDLNQLLQRLITQQS